MKNNDDIKKVKDKVSKAVFLDRDGTINVEMPYYVSKKEEFVFINGVIDGLKILTKTDYKLVIITNQGGIAKGLYDEEKLKEIHEYMIDELEKNGINIYDVYYCPHHPEGNLKEYSIICECRKPSPRMLKKASEELNINLKESWVIGDKIETDILLGKNLSCKTILITTGKNVPDDYYVRIKKMMKIGNMKNEERPDFIADSIVEAAKIITGD